MLMKLTPGVNFIHVLRAAFMHEDPKSAKKTVKLSFFLVLLGSPLTKAARKMLVKSIPGHRCVEKFVELNLRFYLKNNYLTKKSFSYTEYKNYKIKLQFHQHFLTFCATRFLLLFWSKANG